jgi:DNA phosphorothioation-dependent restriction protein DptG
VACFREKRHSNFSSAVQQISHLNTGIGKQKLQFVANKWHEDVVLVEDSPKYLLTLSYRLNMAALFYLLYLCSLVFQAVNVTLRVLPYSAILHSVLNFPLLCSGHFIAYSTVSV